jgi:hypothetical protein
MKIYNWKDCIQDRHKWKKIVEKAITFNYWSCRAWRRRIRRSLFWKGKWDGDAINRRVHFCWSAVLMLFVNTEWR